MEEKELQERLFIAEGKALKRKIRNNRITRILGTFVLVFVWISFAIDVIAMFKLGNDTLTLKHIKLQNILHFDALLALIYSIWYSYAIPKGEELCMEAVDSFCKRWSSFQFEKDEEEEKNNEN